MTAIVHKHYQPRSVADEFFAQPIPATVLLLTKPIALQNVFLSNLSLSITQFVQNAVNSAQKFMLRFIEKFDVLLSTGLLRWFLSCLCDVSVAISAVLELWRTLHGYARNLV